MDNSRQSAVLQDSVGKCCFFSTCLEPRLLGSSINGGKRRWEVKFVIHILLRQLGDIYVYLVPNPLPYTDARMNALRVQTATCIFDLDG